MRKQNSYVYLLKSENLVNSKRHKSQQRILKMRRYGRSRRNDYDREGPIHIYISTRHALGGFLILILGATIRGLSDHYSNASKISEDHQCPALQGRIHNWVANLGNLFIVLSMVLLSVGGVYISTLLIFLIQSKDFSNFQGSFRSYSMSVN